MLCRVSTIRKHGHVCLIVMRRVVVGGIITEGMCRGVVGPWQSSLGITVLFAECHYLLSKLHAGQTHQYANALDNNFGMYCTNSFLHHGAGAIVIVWGLLLKVTGPRATTVVHLRGCIEGLLYEFRATAIVRWLLH